MALNTIKTNKQIQCRHLPPQPYYLVSDYLGLFYHFRCRWSLGGVPGKLSSVFYFVLLNTLSIQGFAHVDDTHSLLSLFLFCFGLNNTTCNRFISLILFRLGCLFLSGFVFFSKSSFFCPERFLLHLAAFDGTCIGVTYFAVVVLGDTAFVFVDCFFIVL